MVSRNITLRLTCVAVSSPKSPISETAQKKSKKQKREREKVEAEMTEVQIKEEKVDSESDSDTEPSEKRQRQLPDVKNQKLRMKKRTRPTRGGERTPKLESEKMLF